MISTQCFEYQSEGGWTLIISKRACTVSRRVEITRILVENCTQTLIKIVSKSCCITFRCLDLKCRRIVSKWLDAKLLPTSLKIPVKNCSTPSQSAPRPNRPDFLETFLWRLWSQMRKVVDPFSQLDLYLSRCLCACGLGRLGAQWGKWSISKDLA